MQFFLRFSLSYFRSNSLPVFLPPLFHLFNYILILSVEFIIIFLFLAFQQFLFVRLPMLIPLILFFISIAFNIFMNVFQYFYFPPQSSRLPFLLPQLLISSFLQGVPNLHLFFYFPSNSELEVFLIHSSICPP